MENPLLLHVLGVFNDSLSNVVSKTVQSHLREGRIGRVLSKQGDHQRVPLLLQFSSKLPAHRFQKPLQHQAGMTIPSICQDVAIIDEERGNLLEMKGSSTREDCAKHVVSIRIHSKFVQSLTLQKIIQQITHAWVVVWAMLNDALQDPTGVDVRCSFHSMVLQLFHDEGYIIVAQQLHALLQDKVSMQVLAAGQDFAA